MLPMKLSPIFKDYIWGGSSLSSFGKMWDGKNIAESWELCCHKDGTNMISSGEFTGKNLLDYLKSTNFEAVSKDKQYDNLPILIKYIDAKENLSVQVHPDDKYALKNENQFGKTEIWYILDATPDAFIYYGFSGSYTKDEVKKHIENDTIESIMNKVPTKKGDFFFIHAGTLHAIGKGNIIAEIQQNSNVTYRIYDYNRTDDAGNKRELHIEKALDVLNFTNCQQNSQLSFLKFDGYNMAILAKCNYFSSAIYKIEKSASLNCDSSSFNSICCIDGSGIISNNDTEIEINKGDSFFIDAGFGKYEIRGNLEIIITSL